MKYIMESFPQVDDLSLGKLQTYIFLLFLSKEKKSNILEQLYFHSFQNASTEYQNRKGAVYLQFIQEAAGIFCGSWHS